MPESIPRCLKILILAILVCSLVGAFSPLLQALFALSWSGVKFFYFWQFLTYLLVEQFPLSFSFFVNLAFNLFLLFAFGSSLLARVSSRSFFLLYFGSALFASLATLSVLPFTHSFLAGSGPPIYAILVAWMMLHPQTRLLLFFTIPCKSHWLILGLIVFNLAVYLSSSEWAHAVSLFAASLFGYFYSLLVWREEGPFAFLNPFERAILRLFEKKKAKSQPSSSKIFDFHSGEPILNDDQFMDAMLARIAKSGESSLTAAEKKRMREISERKAKKR